MYITDEQLSLYKKDGFLIVENFLNEKERKSALDGFYKHFAPPYQHYLDNNRENNTPKEVLFPWDHTGLNHVTTHPDLINAAERVLGTRRVRTRIPSGRYRIRRRRKPFEVARLDHRGHRRH